MKNIIQSVKGTRDFYPQEMALRTWLYNKVREVSERYGYQEFEGPLLETIELYAAKSGEELVKEQSFVFPDRSGDMLTLRPELTPTLMRMVAEKQKQLTFPLRWWSFGPFWRYERPQKGRSREFFQWNIDLIGVATPEGDAELVAIMADLFQSFKLKPEEAKVFVNNRRLIDSELSNFGFSQDEKLLATRLIDRSDKLDAQSWEKYGLDSGLTTQQLSRVKSILSDEDLWKKSDELIRCFSAVNSLGLENYIQFDPTVIRGLDYYTGIVYEGKACESEIRRSIAGGGRYDNLLSDVGGEPLPGTGFAMGDMVIMILLEKYGLLPANLDASPAPVMVTIFDSDHLLESFQLAMELRQSGLKVATYPTPDKLGKQFKYADRIGTKVVVILGPDEINTGQVAVKNLQTRIQENIDRRIAANHIQKMLA